MSFLDGRSSLIAGTEVKSYRVVVIHISMINEKACLRSICSRVEAVHSAMVASYPVMILDIQVVQQKCVPMHWVANDLNVHRGLVTVHSVNIERSHISGN